MSESEALLGMDPMMHAELALKDVEKVHEIQSSWPKSYYRKAVSLILLERYGDARETLLSGLQVDPSRYTDFFEDRHEKIYYNISLTILSSCLFFVKLKEVLFASYLAVYFFSL